MYRENSPTPHHRAEIGGWAPEDMQARVLRTYSVRQKFGFIYFTPIVNCREVEKG
jgi:hypothetical protein